MARDTTDFRPIESIDELVALSRRRQQAAREMAHRHRAREVRVLCRRQRPVPYGGERGIRALLEGMQATLGWEPILDAGPHHRPGRADRPGRDLAGARRPVRAFRRAAGDDPPDLPRGQCASGAGARDRRAARHPLPRPRRQPEMDARRNAENAEIALRDHDALHAEGRHQGPRHDVPHLHDPGEPRLLERGRHAPQDAGVAEAAAAVDGAVRQLALHRRPAERAAISWRGEIWRDTDNQRSGLLPFCFSPDFGFADYVEWALDVPMYFVIRDGRYHDMTHITFRQFMDGRGAQRDSRRRADDRRLGEPSLDAVSRCAAEALPGDARRRWRAVAAHLRPAGILGRAALRRRGARRRRDADRDWTYRRGAGDAQRRAGARHRRAVPRQPICARSRARCSISPASGSRTGRARTATAMTKRFPVDAGRGGGARHHQRRGNAQRLPYALGRLDRAGVSWSMPTRRAAR